MCRTAFALLDKTKRYSPTSLDVSIDEESSPEVEMGAAAGDDTALL